MDIVLLQLFFLYAPLATWVSPCIGKDLVTTTIVDRTAKYSKQDLQSFDDSALVTHYSPRVLIVSLTNLI